MDREQYWNSNQCGWFPLEYDFQGTEYQLGDFAKLDHGFDVYAPQVFRDETGRAILLGWMSTPDADYDCESTLDAGWVHAMTVPRELSVNSMRRLCQTPLAELGAFWTQWETASFTGDFQRKTSACFQLKLRMKRPDTAFTLNLRESAILRYQEGVLSLDMNNCGLGRGSHSLPLPEGVSDLQILSDSSSLEIFVNDGSTVFTTRIL